MRRLPDSFLFAYFRGFGAISTHQTDSSITLSQGLRRAWILSPVPIQAPRYCTSVKTRTSSMVSAWNQSQRRGVVAPAGDPIVNIRQAGGPMEQACPSARVERAPTRLAQYTVARRSSYIYVLSTWPPAHFSEPELLLFSLASPAFSYKPCYPWFRDWDVS